MKEKHCQLKDIENNFKGLILLTKDEFKKTLGEAEQLLEDLSAMIERDSSPMRNG